MDGIQLSTYCKEVFGTTLHMVCRMAGQYVSIFIPKLFVQMECN